MLPANLESIKVPTQSQLRELAYQLDATQLSDLGLTPVHARGGNESDDRSSFSPTEIFTAIQHVKGRTREQVWQLASAIVPQTSTETFTLFEQLPFDLRDKIWKLATHTSNVVELSWQWDSHRWWATPFCRVAPPSVFMACKESRGCTKHIRERKTTKAFGTHFNLYTDLLFLHSAEDLNRRFMNFCMDLYEAWNSDGEAVKKLPRLAMCSWSWYKVFEDMDMGEEDEDYLTVGGRSGLLRENLTGLKELVLVDVLEVDDTNRRRFRDERVLVEDELVDVNEACDGFRKNLLLSNDELILALEILKYEPHECEISWKLLYRSDHGEEGS